MERQTMMREKWQESGVVIEIQVATCDHLSVMADNAPFTLTVRCETSSLPRQHHHHHHQEQQQQQKQQQRETNNCISARYWRTWTPKCTQHLSLVSLIPSLIVWCRLIVLTHVLISSQWLIAWNGVHSLLLFSFLSSPLSTSPFFSSATVTVHPSPQSVAFISQGIIYLNCQSIVSPHSTKNQQQL